MSRSSTDVNIYIDIGIKEVLLAKDQFFLAPKAGIKEINLELLRKTNQVFIVLQFRFFSFVIKS